MGVFITFRFHFCSCPVLPTDLYDTGSLSRSVSGPDRIEEIGLESHVHDLCGLVYLVDPLRKTLVLMIGSPNVNRTFSLSDPVVTR